MSKIEWTHRPGTKSEVWNPVSGCSLESAGCANCYAMHFAHRFSGEGMPFEGLTKNTNSGVKWNGKIRLNTDRLTIPLSWKKPRTCFVNSMSDLFHPDVPFDFIDNVFAVMDCCPDSTFIVLTKRADRMLEYYNGKRAWRVGQLKVSYDSKDYDLSAWPLKNVWIGVSVEDQKTADERIPSLLQCPGPIRFISYEPALGPVNILNTVSNHVLRNMILGDAEMSRGIQWVIAGGESGNKARPPHPDWFRTIRDQCKSAGIPYFFKQFGQWMPGEEGIKSVQQLNILPDPPVGTRDVQLINYKGVHNNEVLIKPITEPLIRMFKVGKHLSGNTLDGVQHLEYPKEKNLLI